MNELKRTEIMGDGRKCPQCGALLPAGALAGLCPACLLKQGATADTATQPEAAAFQPPGVDEVARMFPQLEILAFIGKGGMGAVYKARQPALDRLVALKILPSQAASGPGFAERFNREARALAKLNHPNIVAIHDFGQANGLPFFSMEFVDGLNLRELERAGKLSPREALKIVPQICEALQFAHDEGIVHRDIKPENILLDKKGRVKIADFGIAKIMSTGGAEASDALRPGTEPDAPDRRPALQASLTEGQAIGTPHYMAPEQVERPRTVDHRADIYSLGVVFYEMLTGELPLGKFQPPSAKVQVDVRLDEVVLHALEKEPERRYQHASEVKTDIETIAAVAPAPVVPQAAPAAPMNPWQPAILVVAALISITLFPLATAVPRPLNWIVILFCSFGLIISIVKLAGLWPFPSGLFPKSNFTGRNLRLGNLPPPAQSSASGRAAAESSGFEIARRQVKGPATGLVVTGILNWVAIPFMVLVLGGVQDENTRHTLLPLVPLAAFVLSSVMIAAGLKMRHLEAYGLAIAGSILAILVTPGNVIGLPLGIWALVALTRPEVRGAFESNRRGNAWKFAALVAGVLLLIIAVPVGTWLLSRQRFQPPPVNPLQIESDYAAKAPTSVAADKIAVEHLAMRILAAIRDKDDAALKEFATDGRVKGWRDSLPEFAFELREKFRHIAGKPFDMQAAESLVRDDVALVKCTGPKELGGVYLALFFVKTGDGWKNCWLHNAPASTPLEDSWKQVPAKLVQIGNQNAPPISGAEQAPNQEIARLKLQAAEQTLREVLKQVEVGAALPMEAEKARFDRDIAAAALNGDAVEMARLKLQFAELELKDAEKRRDAGIISGSEYEKAKLARDIAAAELKQLQKPKDQ